MTNKGSAIVTGGTSGIGLAVARMLLTEGFNVTLWARDVERGMGIQQQLTAEDFPGKVTFCPCDVSSPESVVQATAEFVKQNSDLKILVNAAGIMDRTPLSKSDPESISNQIDIILKGTIYTTTALANDLAGSSPSVVINLGSVAGQLPFPGLGAYGAAKAGVAHFTKTAAQELFASGVRVLCVCPGLVKTDLMPDEELAALADTTPGRRLQSADEVACLVVELAKPVYSSLTGAVIDLHDGIGLFSGNRPTEPLPMSSTLPTSPNPGANREELMQPISQTASPLTETDPILLRVAKVLQVTFGMDPSEVTHQTSPEDVAKWDSLGNLRLIANLEKEFACNLDVNEIMEMTNVAGIVQVMKGKTR